MTRLLPPRRLRHLFQQLALAVRPDHEQRRQLALRDADGKLDVDAPPIVERAQGLPRRVVARDRIAEMQLVERQARGHKRQMRAALDGEHAVVP